MTGMMGPSWDGLAILALPVLAGMGLLALRGLGQVRPLAVSIARMVSQLVALGVVLRWLFDSDNPWLVSGVVLLMLLISSHAVVSRQTRPSGSLRVEAFLALTLGVFVVMSLALKAALHVDHWYDPTVVLPLLGMMLGGSVNALALAIERLDGEIRADRDRIEWRLALGASARQAARPALRSAIAAGLTPVINGMTIAGLVTIPGMMSGQLLGGADVGVALRFQILVYLGIAGTASISTLALLHRRLRRYFNTAEQLQLEHLERHP